MGISDAEYQERRNMLIPMAEKVANQKHGRNWREHGYKYNDRWVADWNRAFHETMTELCRMRGLVGEG